MNTSLFGVALRDFQPLDSGIAKQLASMVEGGLAVLTFPELNPPQLNAILKALSRAVPPAQAQDPGTDPAGAEGRRGELRTGPPAQTPETDTRARPHACRRADRGQALQGGWRAERGGAPDARHAEGAARRVVERACYAIGYGA